MLFINIFALVLSFQSWMISPSSIMWTLESPSLWLNTTAQKVKYTPSLTLSLGILIVTLKILILLQNMKTKTMLDSSRSKTTLPGVAPLLVSVALSTILAVVSISCAAPKTSVRVRNNATGSETTISVRNGEGSSTQVSVSPSMQLDSLSFNFSKNGYR